jgi:plasmid stabilization system protein ParE
MQVRWSPPAAEDLERICEWIERENPEAARTVARTIYAGCARLRDFPNLGRASLRIEGRRELIFAPLPYIVVYQVRPNAMKFPVFSTVHRTGRNSDRAA